jgi:hypothetical protein
MYSNADFWLRKQQRKVEAEAAGNQGRLRGARTLDEVVRLGDVHLPPELRALRGTIPGLRLLESEVQRRLEELVTAALKLIADKETVEDAKKQRGRLMQECSVLRGKYGQFYRRADTESARLVYKKEQAAKTAVAPPEEPPQS